MHPLIGNLRELKMDELIQKMNELNDRYSISMQLGNAALANQVRMIMETYREEYQRRMVEIAEDARNKKYIKDKVKTNNDK